MKITLVGFMGAGKTTVGNLLSDKLGIRHVSTDELVEKEVGMSISDIFRTYGEEFFRERERDILKGLLFSSDSIVISTGGGVPSYRDNMELINRYSVSVYLECGFDSLWRRISGDAERPLVKLGREALKRLFLEREPFYRKAKIVVDTENLTPEETTLEILNLLSRMNT